MKYHDLWLRQLPNTHLCVTSDYLSLCYLGRPIHSNIGCTIDYLTILIVYDSQAISISIIDAMLRSFENPPIKT